MPNDDSSINLRQYIRATFPYLVFIIVFILGMVVVMVWASAAESGPAVLTRAHSHNDYEHERPLLDALDLGFCSVEADIHLVDGALLVAHDRDKVDASRTLESLYLKPLWARFEEKGGHIYGDPAPFTLLIDIKSDGAETFRALHEVLAAYAGMLTQFTDEATTAGAVTVIISGNRATEEILAARPRYAGIDGRLADLEGPLNPHQYPLVSDHWFRHFKWAGTGDMLPSDVEKLNATVARAGELGVRLRFWAIPQHEAVWGRLYDAGVDLLNADDLAGLQVFLVKKAGKD